MDGFVMKKNNLYNLLTLECLISVYNKQIRVNTKNKRKIYKFEEYYSANMSYVDQILHSENYQVAPYNIFLIRDPKYRIIMSQKMNDKIINHAVASILGKVLEPCLVNTNVATRKGKGTHYGIYYLKKYLNQMKSQTIYALKFDIAKYFYNIDHKVLKRLLRKKIRDENYLKILFRIIDSTNINVNDKIKKIKEKEIIRLKESNLSDKEKRIKDIENIPSYRFGKGLPIGNMTSQIMAVYYLNDLDHFIKEKLHIKAYIRYMDDGVLLFHDKNYLKYCLKEIKKELRKYHLQLNQKTKIINVSKNGIDFLGFHFYLFHHRVIMKVRKQTKQKFCRKMKYLEKKYQCGKISKKEVSQIIASYHGHLKHGNTYFLQKKCFKFFEG